MKRCTFPLLAVALLLLPRNPATAQDVAKPSPANHQDSKALKISTKAITIPGQVSLDGKTLLSNEDDIWAVSNPEVLTGHEGKLVVVRCQVFPNKNEIRIFYVKAEMKEVKYSAKKGDSAFRR